MRTAISAFTAMAMLLGGSTAGASGPRPEPTVSVRDTGEGVYVVEARFEVPERAAIARDVLTDYSNIPRFVPDIRTSIVHERTGGHARVEQEAVSRFMFFSKRVHLLLDIHDDGEAIRFRDTCGRSFVRYEGSWHVTQHDGYATLSYELTAQPAFSVPQFLISRVMGRDAKDMIDHLRTEITRRAITAGAAGGERP